MLVFSVNSQVRISRSVDTGYTGHTVVDTGHMGTRPGTMSAVSVTMMGQLQTTPLHSTNTQYQYVITAWHWHNFGNLAHHS